MVNQMFYQDNGVKGMLLNRRCSSSARVLYAKQVDPDRQPATASNKDMLKNSNIECKNSLLKRQIDQCTTRDGSFTN